MFCQADFGVRIKELRRVKGLSQREAALQMGVSEQAISKWESGACLPDVYHLKLLGKVLGVSVDCLLDVEREQPEKVLETFQAGGAVFELVEKPETILAGKLLYAKDFGSIQEFDSAIEAFSEEEKQAVYGRLVGSVLPVRDIQLSVNFWLAKKTRGFGFMREVTSVQQPGGVDVYQMPASLFLRAYTDRPAAQLLSKERCETWELFAYFREYFMPAHGFEMAENGAQELEVFDTSLHDTGYAYVPVVRKRV